MYDKAGDNKVYRHKYSLEGCQCFHNCPMQIYTLPEPKGFILFYVSYTSCGSCNDTLLLRKNGPQVVLADHKRGQKGAKK